MDVPYAGLLPFNPKYFAKSDLKKVPVLGNAIALANHVLVDRDDRRSQMEALVQGRQVLRSGLPLFVFPEGTRGPEGRLQPFKMGAFKVAMKAGVPVVPVSMAGTHLVMPRWAIMPVQPGSHVTAVHVHPPIQTQGLSDKEIAQAAFDVINAALPPEQQYVPSQESSEEQES
jgi:1-acyl-sn-glycerol-3-phosphate acyltransferase